MTRNPIAQLASLGEEVLDKASQNPTTARLVPAWKPIATAKSQPIAGFRP